MLAVVDPKKNLKFSAAKKAVLSLDLVALLEKVVVINHDHYIFNLRTDLGASHTNSLATGFDEGGSNLFGVVARLLELTMSNFCVLEKL